MFAILLIPFNYLQHNESKANKSGRYIDCNKNSCRLIKLTFTKTLKLTFDFFIVLNNAGVTALPKKTDHTHLSPILCSVLVTSSVAWIVDWALCKTCVLKHVALRFWDSAFRTNGILANPGNLKCVESTNNCSFVRNWSTVKCRVCSRTTAAGMYVPFLQREQRFSNCRT